MGGQASGSYGWTRNEWAEVFTTGLVFVFQKTLKSLLLAVGYKYGCGQWPTMTQPLASNSRPRRCTELNNQMDKTGIKTTESDNSRRRRGGRIFNTKQPRYLCYLHTNKWNTVTFRPTRTRFKITKWLSNAEYFTYKQSNADVYKLNRLGSWQYQLHQHCVNA